MAQRYSVSTQTVADAYSQLVAGGVVVSRRGSGYFVGQPNHQAAWPDTYRQIEQLDPRRLCSEVTTDPRPAVRLGAGVPADWHDMNEIDAAWRKFARAGWARFSDYGGTRGHEPLREAVAGRLKALGIRASAATTLLTTGATHAIDLLIRHMVRPGETVLVEDPGYFQTHWALKAQGANVVGVPRTADGPDTEALARLCQELHPRFFFMQSVLQNPTGSVLSLPVAYEVLRIAERCDLMVVEDDVSGDLASEHQTRLSMLDQLDRVIYVGSFSKTLPPSLRVGYLATNRAQLLEALTHTKLISTFVSSESNEAFVHALMVDGVFARHVQRVRQRLQDRAKSTVARLEAMGFVMETGYPYRGGSFVWARHPAHPDAKLLADAASAAGIYLAPGCAFRPQQGESPFFRFALALCSPPSLDALANCVRSRS